jgi:hypothetical protein
VSENAAARDDASRLERRARWALRAYPPDYRADWGEEILGTLLEVTPPGRIWPAPRDLTSILAGGTRARRNANQRQGLAVGLRQAAVLGIALYISGVLSEDLSLLRIADWSAWPFGQDVLLAIVSLAATLAAAWSGRRWLTATAAGAAAVCLTLSFVMLDPDYPPARAVVVLIVPLLLLALLVSLTDRAERPPRSWLWFSCVPAGVAGFLEIISLLQFDHGARVLASVGDWGMSLSPFTAISALMAGAAVCWLVTDARPLLGLVLGFALSQIGHLASFSAYASDGFVPASTWQFNWDGLPRVAACVAVAGVLVWLLRRRTRVSSPAGARSR